MFLTYDYEIDTIIRQVDLGFTLISLELVPWITQTFSIQGDNGNMIVYCEDQQAIEEKSLVFEGSQ